MSIEIVTASAGTGKTYRLTELLQAAILEDGIAPEQVVVTTFTRKAAAELQRRCRRRLLATGDAAAAHRLRAARIGTVNSICGQLVTDFAFELGISPEVMVLDEELATRTLRRALSRVVAAEERRELAMLARRMPECDWLYFVERIVEAARSNGMDDEQLRGSQARSLETVVELLGEPATNAAELDQRLRDALDAFIAAYDADVDSTKKTRGAIDRAEQSLRQLRDADLSWGDWATLAKLETGKKSEHLVAPVQAAAAAHDSHPALHADLRRATELTFAIARRAFNSYAEQKRAWGVIDLVDQEVLTLKLLDMPAVREQLRGEIRLVLVDEFQDTSPIQLAIFLKLAELAGRSVWVGDRKQAIFGFRGTDPALMSSAVTTLARDTSSRRSDDHAEAEPSLSGTDPALVDAAVQALEGGAGNVLTRNWRSRPPLVDLTSEVFIAAFADHGFSEAEVRATAAHDEAAGLGPCVEYWELDVESRSRTTEYPRALATAVRDLLADPDATVRDRATGEVRPVTPSDIAILCRRHLTARRVASALGELGVRSALPRPGLTKTPEIRAALAGLRWWVDPRARLPQAELMRILHDPEGEELLDSLVQASTPGKEGAASDKETAGAGTEPFASPPTLPVPALARLEALRASNPDRGPVGAVDAVIEGLDLRDRCRCWGSSRQRLANLDALRALAVRYTETCATQQIGCTTAGLLAHLEDVAATNEDGRAVVAADALTVSTWHAAKGLEWPITVLFDLDWSSTHYDWGVRVASDREQFDASDPLGDRWIRFWPTPYHWNQKQPPFYERLRQHPVALRSLAEHHREQLRLLYVGWTRARDRLVIAAPVGKLTTGILGELRKQDSPLITPPADGDATATWAGHPFELVVRRAMLVEPTLPEPVADEGYPLRATPDHPPRVLRPSSLLAFATATGFERLGEPIGLHGGADPVTLGHAIHTFLAADPRPTAPGESAALRRLLAEHCLRCWKVGSVLDAERLLLMADRLWDWISTSWPNAEVLREVPLEARRSDQTRVRGAADLLVRTGEGWVVIDHKVLRGLEPLDVEKDDEGWSSSLREAAAAYGSQLAAYAAIIEQATDEPVIAEIVHLPLNGVAVALRPVAGTQG
jgi:ATP-dependent exoDNAse (exonuclease V) beta subunit